MLRNKAGDTCNQEDADKHNASTKQQEIRHQCKVCCKTYSNKQILKQHMRRHTGVGLFHCDKCSKSYETKQKIKRHLITHSDVVRIKTDQCPLCKKMFANRSNLNAHMRIHTGERAHKCSTCGKSYQTTPALKIHKQIHTDDRPYECTQCDWKFRHKTKLHRHLLSHAKYPEKEVKMFTSYYCIFCDKSFCHDTLEKHLIRHIGENPYRCQICSQEFREECYMNRHIEKLHKTREKTFACNICGKKYFDKCGLKIHLITHKTLASEFANCCIFCNKRFLFLNGLHTHLRVHTKEMPFQCDICSEEFGYLGNKNAHIRRKHTNEKPYKCGYCNKNFVTKAQLRSHLVTHSKNAGVLQENN